MLLVDVSRDVGSTIRGDPAGRRPKSWGRDILVCMGMVWCGVVFLFVAFLA